MGAKWSGLVLWCVQLSLLACQNVRDPVENLPGTERPERGDGQRPEDRAKAPVPREEAEQRPRADLVERPAEVLSPPGAAEYGVTIAGPTRRGGGWTVVPYAPCRQKACAGPALPLGRASEHWLLGMVDLQGEPTTFSYRVTQRFLPQTLPAKAAAPAALILRSTETSDFSQRLTALLIVALSKGGEARLVLDRTLDFVGRDGGGESSFDTLELVRTVEGEPLSFCLTSTSVPGSGSLPSMPGPPTRHEYRWVEGAYRLWLPGSP